MRKLPRNNVRLEEKKRGRALQDLISVNFSSLIFCHNVRCFFFSVNIGADNSSPVSVSGIC